MLSGVRDMGSNTVRNLFLTIGMTTQEKIKYAEQRIVELETLINYWKNAKLPTTTKPQTRLHSI